MKLEEAVVGSMQIGARDFKQIARYALRITGWRSMQYKAVSNALQRLRRKRRARYDRKWQDWRLR